MTDESTASIRELLADGLASLLSETYRRKQAPDVLIETFGCLAAMAAAVPELRRRIEDLERAVPTYRGVWKQKTPYARGSIVTFSGSLWHSNEDGNLDKPGASEAWVLCVKKGRDANPRKDATP